jgi:hypothetical protein
MNKKSNPKLPSHFTNEYIHYLFKSVWDSTVSTVTRIYAGRSGVQILAEVRELPLLQNTQASSGTHPASK